VRVRLRRIRRVKVATVLARQTPTWSLGSTRGDRAPTPGMHGVQGVRERQHNRKSGGMTIAYLRRP
jgi:hypothetical protein